MALLILLVVFVAILGGAYLLNGWALQILWEWFLVPLGLPILTLPHAIGIAIVAGFLTAHNQPKSEKEKGAEWNALA